MRVTYLGHETLTFPDYLDQATGKTLTADPGGVYDVAPASGRLVPECPAQWFAAAEPPKPAVKGSGTAKAAPGPATEPPGKDED